MTKIYQLLSILLLLLSIPAYAQHECQGGHNCNEDGVIVGAANSSDTVVVGLGGSDMEINDCLATHSVLFGLWQGTHINAMCEAARMDRDGDYLGAAKMRCSTHKYKKIHGKGQTCIDAVIFVPNNPEPVLRDEQTEYVAKKEYEDRIAALEELFDKQEADSQRQQQVQRQQYNKIQHAEEARQKKIDLIREEFGEQTTTASD